MESCTFIGYFRCTEMFSLETLVVVDGKESDRDQRKFSLLSVV